MIPGRRINTARLNDDIIATTPLCRGVIRPLGFLMIHWELDIRVFMLMSIVRITSFLILNWITMIFEGLKFFNGWLLFHFFIVLILMREWRLLLVVWYEWRDLVPIVVYHLFKNDILSFLLLLCFNLIIQPSNWIKGISDSHSCHVEWGVNHYLVISMHHLLLLHPFYRFKRCIHCLISHRTAKLFEVLVGLCKSQPHISFLLFFVSFVLLLPLPPFVLFSGSSLIGLL